MVAEVIGESRWGTWLELLLGGAVSRYGTRDWNLVSTELRARTVCPYAFTPEVCRAKYDDLRKRYSGCKAWFEELRKKRMEELRLALKQSENSIGSLETELESLIEEKGEASGCINNGSEQTQSPICSEKSEGRGDPYCKEFCKDEPSSGSFTYEALRNCSHECHIPATLSAEDADTKREVSEPFTHDKISIGAFCSGLGGTPTKRRGKRKRKDCSRDVKEASVGESGFLDSMDSETGLRCLGHSASNCHEDLRSSGVFNWNKGLTKDGTNNLLEVYNKILEHKSASVFRHRLDSQKRRRYKRLIRRHLDFDTIGSRIAGNYNMSVNELFRDLLLLANNAIVFYSKNTREYKSALFLRDLTTKMLRQHLKDSVYKKASSENLSSNTLVCDHNPLVKPKGDRPGSHKQSKKTTNAGPGKTGGKTTNKSKKTSNANAESSPSVESFPVGKTTTDHPRKVGRISISQQNGVPAKGRKRGRTKQM